MILVEVRANNHGMRADREIRIKSVPKMIRDQLNTREKVLKKSVESRRSKTVRLATDSKRTYDSVSERHLDCLYVIHEEIQVAKSVEDICGIVIDQLVGAMQFPEIALPAISLNGVSPAPDDRHKVLTHGLCAEICAEGEVCGELWVYYTENRPFVFPEEQKLIDHVAEIIGNWIENAKDGMKLRESEQKYRNLFTQIADPVFVFDKRDHCFLDCNQSALDRYGYTLEELRNMTPYQLHRPNEHTKVDKTIDDEVDTSMHRYTHMTKGGEDIQVEVSTAPIEYKGQEAWISIARDITARQHPEEVIRKQSHDLGERVKELNCLYGISRLIEAPDAQLEEILQGIVDLIPPAWQYPEVTCTQLTFEGQVFRTENFKETAWKQTADIVVHGEKVGALDVCYLEEKPEEAEGSFLAEERDLISAVAKRMGSIIETKQAEDKLLKNQYYLTKAQEIGIIGTWEEDIQKKTLTWTDENYKIFGVPPGTEMNYELFMNCVHPDDREYVFEQWSAGLNNEPYDIEHRIIVDDEVKWVREKAEIEFDTEGKAIRAIGFTQDITERKRSENELAKALKVERRQAAQMANELDLASKIQSTLMESSTIAMDGLEMTASWVPANDMSGDFYSLQPLDDHRLGMWVGDVSAKGVPAGLFMVLINAYLQSEMRGVFAPGNVMSQLGRELNELLAEAEQFATLFLGVLDTDNGLLTYSDAGHGQALVFRNATAKIEKLIATAPPIGVEERGLVAQEEIWLQPADVLLIYSDGIPEAVSISGELFGEQRLMSIVEENGHKSPLEIRDAILSAVAEFSPGEMLMDDQTLLVIKRSENL